ncbi:MAG: hypothetical protein IT566_03870 [Rhodospirillaceae bacterium]|nr:hypothetical protein [Rhodospirillaceae bacterium]
MTHHTSKLPPMRAAGHAQPSTHQPSPHQISTHRPSTHRISAPRGVAAARASTTLALSMMVALRYLEGRAHRPEAANAIPDPALL